MDADGGRAAFAGTAAGPDGLPGSRCWRTPTACASTRRRSTWTSTNWAAWSCPSCAAAECCAPVLQDGTFRDLLGLDRPASRYADAAAAGTGK